MILDLLFPVGKYRERDHCPSQRYVSPEMQYGSPIRVLFEK